MRFQLFVSRYQNNRGQDVIRSQRVELSPTGDPPLPYSATMGDRQVLTPYKIMEDRLRGRQALIRLTTNTVIRRLLFHRDPDLLLGEIREYRTMAGVGCVAYRGEDG